LRQADEETNKSDDKKGAPRRIARAEEADGSCDDHSAKTTRTEEADDDETEGKVEIYGDEFYEKR
jgi:hypothetical protein